MPIELTIIIPTIRPDIIYYCFKTIVLTIRDIIYEVIITSPFDIVLPGMGGPLTVFKDDGLNKCKAIKKCVEHAKGKYIFTMADYHFCEDNCLNNIVKMMRLHDNELFVTSPRFKELDGSIREECYLGNYYFARCPCIKKSDIEKIGEFYDTYYADYYADIDLSLRVLEAKGKVELCNDAFLIIRNDLKSSLLTRQKHKNFFNDESLFIDRWMKKLPMPSNLYTIEDAKSI